MNLIAMALCTGLLAASTQPCPLVFDRQQLGDVTYEAASAFDVNNDGHLDIVSGGAWFAGPDFTTQHKICEPMYVSEYYDDFSANPMDVNGDGYLDVITGGYWGMKAMWRENPKGQPVEWTTHTMGETGNIERNVFADIDGDGVDEVFATTGPAVFFRLVRDADGKGQGRFQQYAITKGGGGHGFGVGDVNGDGRQDLLFAGGWHEGPTNPFDVDAYTWHPEWNLGMPSVPIVVFDVNGDGLNDLIVGEAHNYGLYWMEQGAENGQRTWTKHDIETMRSQYHDLQLHDIDNDGVLELITGKRYRAHNGHDPGGHDPVGLYYYEINGGDFQRVTIDYGPAGQASGAGIYFWVADVDGNGWKDIVAPGKEGLFLFKNQGPRP